MDFSNSYFLRAPWVSNSHRKLDPQATLFVDRLVVTSFRQRLIIRKETHDLSSMVVRTSSEPVMITNCEKKLTPGNSLWPFLGWFSDPFKGFKRYLQWSGIKLGLFESPGMEVWKIIFITTDISRDHHHPTKHLSQPQAILGVQFIHPMWFFHTPQTWMFPLGFGCKMLGKGENILS